MDSASITIHTVDFHPTFSFQSSTSRQGTGLSEVFFVTGPSPPPSTVDTLSATLTIRYAMKHTLAAFGLDPLTQTATLPLPDHEGPCRSEAGDRLCVKVSQCYTRP